MGDCGLCQGGLAAAMLRSLTDEFAPDATNLEEEWTARYAAGVGLQESLRQECSAVANVVLNTKLEALGLHSLRESLGCCHVGAVSSLAIASRRHRSW